MTEWQLFDPGTIPFFTTREFFDNHPWIAPKHQMGHNERTEMAAFAIRQLAALHEIHVLTDLGCGDGDLIRRLDDQQAWGLRMEGYTAGVENVNVARAHGLDVNLWDFIAELPELGDLVVMTEVLEHLVAPHDILRRLPDEGVDYIVVSSPSAENDTWHYEHHAWAWDMDGYRKLVEDAGWTIISQGEVVAPGTTHCGEFREQRFQVITARV